MIDSGIAIYVWEAAQFLSVVIYTCKRFDVETALAFTRDFFKTTDMAQLEF